MPDPVSNLTPVLTDTDYRRIAELVYVHSRISLGDGKRELVSSRLGKRLRLLECGSYADYCALLAGPEGAEEINHLVDAISTNHTFFFREKKHFDFCEEVVLPQFHADAAYRGDGCLRCWSAAASTGEEPYSIAILLALHAEKSPGFRWELDCSDISRSAIESARSGVYPDARIEGVPAEWRRKFFQKGVGSQAGNCRIKAAVRAPIRWHLMNLFQEVYPFDKKFHVIFCRNVMIYFDRPSQEWLVQRMSRLLSPGGYLMVGHSESLSGIHHGLQMVKPAIYRKAPR